MSPARVPPSQKAIDARVGARLRAERKLQGLSQTTVAERVGIAYQQLQKYERGQNRITAGRLIALAAALGVDPGRVLTDSAREAGVPADVAARGRRLAELYVDIDDNRQRAALLEMAESLADPEDTP